MHYCESCRDKYIFSMCHFIDFIERFGEESSQEGQCIDQWITFLYSNSWTFVPCVCFFFLVGCHYLIELSYVFVSEVDPRELQQIAMAVQRRYMCTKSNNLSLFLMACSCCLKGRGKNLTDSCGSEVGTKYCFRPVFSPSKQPDILAARGSWC